MAGNPVIDKEASPEYTEFKKALNYVNTELAKKIAGDGEGATCLFEVKVIGAESKEQAVTLSQSVVMSTPYQGSQSTDMMPTGGGSCVPWDIPEHSLTRRKWICILRVKQGS